MITIPCIAAPLSFSCARSTLLTSILLGRKEIRKAGREEGRKAGKKDGRINGRKKGKEGRKERKEGKRGGGERERERKSFFTILQLQKN
jgi:hypothetical protein